MYASYHDYKHLWDCRNLRLLNVEGNQLGALPCGALQLTSLKYLNIKNNYVHPLFWQEHSRNSPQVGHNYQMRCRLFVDLFRKKQVKQLN